MRSRSNAIDGTFANGNQRGRHHDGHAARPLLGQDAHDIVFYVSLLIGTSRCGQKMLSDDGGATVHQGISSNDAFTQHTSNVTSISTAASGFRGPSLCASCRPSLAAGHSCA